MSQPPAPDFTRLGDARIFIDRMAYADLAWHAAAARLRAVDPLPLIEVEGYVPFRAVTRHADVAEVERNHTLFWNTRDSVLLPHAQIQQSRQLGLDIKTLIHMDGAEHRQTRALTNEWFKPANLRKEIGQRLPALARRFIDRMLEHDGACDFVRDIALYYPLHVKPESMATTFVGGPKRMPIRYRIRAV